MARAETKRALSRNIKRYIIQYLRGKLLGNLPSISEKITDGFETIVAVVGDVETSLDLLYIKGVFTERLEDFDFLPDMEVQNKLSLTVPSIDSFDFSGIEILELILNGMVGEYAEANFNEVTAVFGDVHTQLLTLTSIESDDIMYLVPVTEDLLVQEETLLGYTLNRFPFSNSPPMHEEFFEPVNTYIKTNMPGWISESIKKSITTVKNKYGGK